MTIVDYTRAKSLRFYPKAIPPFPHEPTQDRFRIMQLGEGQGQGVVSLVDFREGEIVFAFTGFYSSEVTQFSLQINENLHLHDPYFYGKIIHSCDPNCFVDLENRRFVATRAIGKGELVTMDYAQTEDILYKSFPCACGSANCRGIVQGKKQLPPEMPAVAQMAGRST